MTKVNNGGLAIIFLRNGEPMRQDKIADMQWFRLIAAFGLIVMISALAFGFSNGNFFTEGNHLMTMPWGIVTIVDIYVGLLFFSAWVWYREKSTTVKVFWTLLFIGLGNLATAVYLIKALTEARGNMNILSSGYRSV